MKILIVHPKVPIYGGAERVIIKFCEYLSKNAIVHAVAMPDLPANMLADLFQNGTPVIKGLASFMASVNNYDIVFYHNFPATLYSMVTNKPGVWLCNEPPELFTNQKRKFVEWGNRNLVRNRIQNVIVADKFNSRRFFDIYNVVPRIIPYGIDYEFFSQAEHNPDREYFTVMQVGTISRYKNQIATIEAVGEAKKTIPNIRLWLIGNVSEVDYKNEVEQKIRDCGLAGDVVFEPHVERGHLRYLYSKADVLLHPVKEQGGWLSPFEAISAGCPVIVSNELTCSDMIDNNELGLVARDYVKALKLVYEYPSIKNYHARNWVRDNLTWDSFGESVIKYFEEILSEDKPGESK